jgi:hypothetical protein
MFTQLLVRAFCLCFGCTVVALVLAFVSGCSADTFYLPLGDGGSFGDVQSDALISPDAVVGDGGNEATLLSDANDANDGFDGYVGPTYRRVFVTSGTYAPSFGGLAGADGICMSVASGASLGGKWAAWLSSLSVSASSRLEHSSVPYKLLDGTVIASDWSDLTSGSIQHPINRDEHGALVTNPGATYSSDLGVWTNTNGDGSSTQLSLFYTCNDWTNATSSYDFAGGSVVSDSSCADHQCWTIQGTADCSEVLALYCFEQP